MKNEYKYVVVGWDYVYNLLLTLAKRINKSNFDPEIIVGLARGGWLPARILSDFLDNPNLASIKVEFYIDIYKTLQEPVISQKVSVPVKNKRILLVDDITDSGKSLRTVINDLMNKTNCVKTATLYYKRWSCVKPDFFAKETDAWIVFPWEYRETIKKLGNRFLNEGKSLQEIEDKLVNTGLTPSLVKRFVNELFGKTANV